MDHSLNNIVAFESEVPGEGWEDLDFLLGWGGCPQVHFSVEASGPKQGLVHKVGSVSGSNYKDKVAISSSSNTTHAVHLRQKLGHDPVSHHISNQEH